jgi:uncharacterized protein YggU (UPF0235/DUF167 family)
VKVTPKARRNAIGGSIADPAAGPLRLKVAVTAPPADGAANEAVIALLAREWRLPRSALSVVAGAGDRRKTIRIDGDPAALAGRLEAWWAAQPFAAP